MPSAADLPYLRATLRVDFYPYTPPGKDPVFAVTGGQQTFVCRPSLDRDNAIEIIREFRDEEKDLELNSLVWSREVDKDNGEGDPLICLAGSPSSVIRVLNVRTGKLTRCLAGHGASFHSSGRYLISGAMDSAIKIWVVPELPDMDTGTDKVNIIHYPHFSTTEVHSDMVDWSVPRLRRRHNALHVLIHRSVLFYGDLVLSRSAKENQILLWKIDGFNSNSPPPPLSTAGHNEAYGINNPDDSSDAYGSTASAFGRRFQRLLSFDTPMTPLFYNRFGLFHMPNKHPILVMGNERSRFMWWDLQRLEEGSDDGVKTEITFRVPNKRKRTDRDGSGGRGSLLSREESIASNASSGVASTGTGSSSGHSNNSHEADTKVAVKRSWISDPFTPVPSHKSIVIPKMTFCSRQVAWSVGGEWAVAVGDHGMVCLFRRWD
ncbi:hypothetical protein SLS58_006746 [Diplodia intermedia]|uniref:WD40 repeat-like protein n=1 Tax=Diplodia intermedia TaxID=856260 RepID=A0ABR3TN45_9PEZI